MVQSLGLGIDARSGEPIYQQIFDQVVTRIRSGAFPAGFRLPPSRSLGDALGANRNTVVRAYDELLAAGFVESSVGRGTYVARQQPPAAKGALGSALPEGTGELPWSTLVARTVLAEPLSRVDRLQRSMSAMSTDFINMARMEPSPDQIPEDLLRRCAEHVLRTLGARALGYSPREGLPRLRGLIAHDLARQGVPATADDIVVTSGSQQALDLVARALINAGESFIVNQATYGGAINVLAAAGARLVPVASDDDGPSLGALERVAHLGAKGMYLMPSGHNPTGASISQPRREALVAWSRRTGVPIIEDDYVADLDLDGDAAPAPMRALDRDVIYVGTFSKRLAPALRVGFIVTPPILRSKIVLLKHAMDLGNSALLQHILAEFLERGYLGAHLSKLIPEYRARRDALEGSLRRHLPKDLIWRRPQRGLSLWLPLPPSLPSQAVFEEAQRKGVLVHPSSLNAVDEGAAGGIRLTFCTEPKARLVEGARRLGRAIAALGRDRGEALPAMGGV
jgi:GntR family transcriptional regulator/MocR family aminotransferase